MLLKLAAPLHEAISGLRKFVNAHGSEARGILPLAKSLNRLKQVSTIAAKTAPGTERNAALFAKDSIVKKIKNNYVPEEVTGLVRAGHQMNTGKIKTVADLESFAAEFKKS